MLSYGQISVSLIHQIRFNTSNNYRPIALSCIFGKVLDQTLLNTQYNSLNTSNWQFGFKQNSSTVMCSSVIIEAILEYYMDSNPSVYLLLIDAQKTFD